MDRAARVEELEEVPLVGLVPVDAGRGDGAADSLRSLRRAAGVTRSCSSAGHVVQIVNSVDLKGEMAFALNKSEITPRVGDFWEIDHAAIGECHAKTP